MHLGEQQRNKRSRALWFAPNRRACYATSTNCVKLLVAFIVVVAIYRIYVLLFHSCFCCFLIHFAFVYALCVCGQLIFTLHNFGSHSQRKVQSWQQQLYRNATLSSTESLHALRHTEFLLLNIGCAWVQRFLLGTLCQVQHFAVSGLEDIMIGIPNV